MQLRIPDTSLACLTRALLASLSRTIWAPPLPHCWAAHLNITVQWLPCIGYSLPDDKVAIALCWMVEPELEPRGSLNIMIGSMSPLPEPSLIAIDRSPSVDLFRERSKSWPCIIHGHAASAAPSDWPMSCQIREQAAAHSHRHSRMARKSELNRIPLNPR